MPPRPVHLCHRRRPCASHLLAAEAAAEVVGGINQRENDVGAAARATFGASRRPAAGEQSSGGHVERRLASDHVAPPPAPPAPRLLPLLQPLPVRSHSARFQQESWTEHVWPELKPKMLLFSQTRLFGFYFTHSISVVAIQRSFSVDSILLLSVTFKAHGSVFHFSPI